ncbi:MAG TPA: DUF1292 domain-containing protein [Clostridiaceae bacterium]|jgi:uncharacterized protein YrzB (UPF0473 family)|nr:DUF1292 domain-containing protein [Clostridiaceae bacterium]
MTLIQLMYATPDDGCCDEPECCEGGGELFDEDDFVVLTDTETGEEYPFMLVDNFEFEGESYCVLIDPDDIEEEEVSIFFMKLIESEDGEEVLTGLDEDEDERVFAAYEEFMDERDEAEFED